MSDKPVKAACHCGTVRFTVLLTNGIATARRCNCSICTMRGAVAVSAPLDGVVFEAGEENLTLYQFNTGTAEHYFCRTCGIYTHHKRRSNPNEFGINLSCLEGWSPWDLPEIAVTNGRQHSADGFDPQAVGVLRFEEAKP